MTGQSHKAIGTAAGVALAIYGIRQGDPAFTLALVSAPLAAMLPDIDHSGARIGKMRKQVANVAVTVLAVAVIVVAWYHGRYIINDYSTLLMIGLGVVIPTFFLFKLSQTKWVRDTWGFVAKHRGIMHTLIIPICAVVATLYIREHYFLILIYGFIAGYLSHILADCLTVKGCPILFPFTKKNVKLSNVKTGSEAERTHTIVLIASIIIISIFVSF